MNLTDVTLAWPPETVPQLLVGATGPKTLALSGELAPGTVLSGGTTPDGVRRAIAHIGGVGSRGRRLRHLCFRFRRS